MNENKNTPDEIISEKKKVICKKVKQPSKNSIFIRRIKDQIIKSNRIKYKGDN